MPAQHVANVKCTASIVHMYSHYSLVYTFILVYRLYTQPVHVHVCVHTVKYTVVLNVQVYGKV
jgi:hypothetical protein